MATSASAGAAGAAPQLAAAPTTLNAAAGEVLRAVVRGPLGAADKHEYVHGTALTDLLGAFFPTARLGSLREAVNVAGAVIFGEHWGRKGNALKSSGTGASTHSRKAATSTMYYSTQPGRITVARCIFVDIHICSCFSGGAGEVRVLEADRPRG